MKWRRRIEDEREPRIDLRLKGLEVSRHHAGNHRGLSIEGDRAADDRAVAPERRHPERVTEHDDVRGSGCRLAVVEASADERSDAKCAKEVRRGARPRELSWL